jgi:hypothetical protein
VCLTCTQALALGSDLSQEGRVGNDVKHLQQQEGGQQQGVGSSRGLALGLPRGLALGPAVPRGLALACVRAVREKLGWLRVEAG